MLVFKSWKIPIQPSNYKYKNLRNKIEENSKYKTNLNLIRNIILITIFQSLLPNIIIEAKV